MNHTFVLIVLYTCDLEVKIVGCYKWEDMFVVSGTCAAVDNAAWTLKNTYNIYNIHIYWKCNVYTWMEGRGCVRNVAIQDNGSDWKVPSIVKRVHKMRNMTISFVMSVRLSPRLFVPPSAHPSAWNNSVPTWGIFIKFDICVFF